MPTELRIRNASSNSAPLPPTSDLRPPASDVRLPTSNLESRCTHTYADGRRCRSTPAPHSSLCAQHSRPTLATSDSLLPTDPSPLSTIHSPPATSSTDLDVSSDLLGP